MCIFQQSELWLFDTLQFISQVAELNIGHTLSFEDLIFQIFVFLLKQLDWILVVILNFEIFGKDLLYFWVFGVDDLF